MQFNTGNFLEVRQATSVLVQGRRARLQARACTAAWQAGYRVGLATEADVPKVAELCAQAFSEADFKGLPEVPSALDRRLKDAAAAAIRRDVEKELTAALLKKRQCAIEAREFRLRKEIQRLRGQLAGLGGGSVVLSGPERKEVRRWTQARKFACFIARAEETGEVVGCAVLSLSVPEALLPAPWPSGKPRRCVVSNVAVAEHHRRKGVARACLCRAELLARRWGQESLWLKAEAVNPAAVSLYSSSGYTERQRDPWLWGPFRKIVFAKHLNVVFRKQGRCEGNQEGQVMGSQGENGLFVWDVQEH